MSYVLVCTPPGDVVRYLKDDGTLTEDVTLARYFPDAVSAKAAANVEWDRTGGVRLCEPERVTLPGDLKRSASKCREKQAHQYGPNGESNRENPEAHNEQNGVDLGNESGDGTERKSDVGDNRSVLARLDDGAVVRVDNSGCIALCVDGSGVLVSGHEAPFSKECSTQDLEYPDKLPLKSHPSEMQEVWEVHGDMSRWEIDTVVAALRLYAGCAFPEGDLVNEHRVNQLANAFANLTR